MERLVDAGEQVAILCRPQSNLWRIDPWVDRVERIVGDMGQAESLRQPLVGFAPDVVYHLAWHGVQNEFRNDPAQVFQNLQSTMQLMNVVADAGETRDLAPEMPDKVAQLLEHAEKARAELGDTLTDRTGAGSRQPGRLTEDEHTALMKTHWPNGRPGR